MSTGSAFAVKLGSGSCCTLDACGPFRRPSERVPGEGGQQSWGLDLDRDNRRSSAEPAQLELLVSSGAERSGISGVLVPTAGGDVQVDVLEVTDAELADLPEDPTGRR